MARSIGFMTALGDYYHQALAIDPGYTKVREYLGEAYLQKGDVAKAKEQLMEIADRCAGLATIASFWSRRSPRT